MRLRNTDIDLIDHVLGQLRHGQLRQASDDQGEISEESRSTMIP